MSSEAGTRLSETKLACRGVWKLFGDRADVFLKRIKPSQSESSQGESSSTAADAAPEREIDNERRISDALGAADLIGAVRDVSLDVCDGEIFVIMGLSGSGKSTLVRCMSRLIEPNAGEIYFNGENLLSASPKRMIEIRRHQMGMVFQHFALLPHLTVLGNVAFPLEVQAVGRAEREARARDMINLVGLEGREYFFPRELSGGQQQRVGIARSLAVEPELWFLDEPFSALDPLIRREMQDEFLRLQSVLKKTIVFITHDFDEAIRLADRVAIMRDGAVVQIGTPEDLVMHPATDYVAEFTRNAVKAKVVRLESVMQPITSSSASSSSQQHCKGDISKDLCVADAAIHFSDAADVMRVVDSHARPVGIVTHRQIVDVMMLG